MADAKLSALTEAATTNVGPSDELYLNDSGSGKRIQFQSLPVSRLGVYLGSDATANSTTTGVEITGLACPTQTGTFKFEYYIHYVSSITTTGVKFGINYDGTQTLLMAFMRYASTGTAATTGAATMAANGATGNIHESFSTRAASTTVPNLGPTVNIDTTGDAMLIIEGIIKVTVAGNLELWHASETGASTTVKADSFLLLTKVA